MYKLIKNYLGAAVKTLKTKNQKSSCEFSVRIMRRHDIFWKAADAETVRNAIIHPEASIEEWKSGHLWQRKLSNKFNSKQFAQLHGCKVSELYWKGRDLSQLNFNTLPDQFVIRPTIGHSCQLVFLMDKHMNHMDRCFYSNEQLKAIMEASLLKNPHQEFLIEEFLKNEKGEYKIPVDYKLSLFNGELAVINVINRTSAKSGQTSCYDQDWNMIEEIGRLYKPSPYQDPPACLQEMITQAKKLSKAYELFVRIDFYATDKGAVFGEFTPTPSKGKGLTSTSDKMFLDYWNKYCHGMI
ncbi:ATP-grasp fold amidoligase family protein [Pontibacter sp. MBLB2868]|uniref:ATP-grasp fold amidoligase family protein n=1 Tax=Pontibacter sp. MBLB2868 TaxID=3451555 RepID=UPI003F754CF4